ncbi:MAG: TonB-dependent receptor [Candidatus Kapaibacterium sp.]
MHHNLSLTTTYSKSAFALRCLVWSALILAFVAPLTLRAQQSVGTLSGVYQPKEQSSVRLRVEVREIMTGSIVEASTIDGSGHFIFRNLPFATYEVRVMKGDSELASARTTINSSVPVILTLESFKVYQGSEVTVETSLLESGRTSPHTFLSAEQIRALPTTAAGKGMEAVLYNTPGTVPDEDGRMHMRGEDAQLQYVIDGIPVTGNQTRVYAPLFNAGLMESVDIMRGGLNAEYGVATSAIVAVTTKSGFDAPIFARASYMLGSFNNQERAVDVGGNINGVAAIYLAYSNSISDRYLDPVSSFDPFHTHGEANHLFGKLNFLLGDKADLVILGSVNNTNYDAPSKVGSLQDQHQELRDYMGGLRLNMQLSDQSQLSVLGYTKQSKAAITSSGLSSIASPADSILALKNERFFIGGRRNDRATGGQIEYSLKSDWLNIPNDFKIGVGGESYPLEEYLTFAITNPAVSDSTPPGDPRYVPYDITKPGGHPFLVDTAATGKRFDAYVQDVMHFENWTVSAGVRFDMFDLFENETGISPRLGIAFAASRDLLLRVSYNRIVMQAPLENILVSSSSQAFALTSPDQGTTPTHLQAERAHVIELGGAYQLNDYLSLDLAGYSKFIDNYLVKVELGNSGVIFPVNLKQGMVFGGELQVRLRNWNNFDGYLAFSTCSAKGVKPTDGSSPFASGLILGEEGDAYNHPFAGEDQFQTEHNQLLTASFNLRYTHSSGFFAVLGGRFDSGLPFDLTDSTGKGPDEAGARAELLRRGYSTEVIDMLNLASDLPGSPDKSVAAHATFDLSLGFRFTKLGLPLTIGATVSNVFDTKYLYKFESTFSGTHYGQPRMFAVQASLEY